MKTDLERINCSRDTTIEQLFGSVVPVYNNNCRTFEWRNGKLLSALAHKKWILLDEINLLRPEVLESLIPLLNGSAIENGFAIPGQAGSGRMQVKGIRLFATMNPAIEGGGRVKLARSFKNLFTVVFCESQSDDELSEILDVIFSTMTAKERQTLVSKKIVEQIFSVYREVTQLVESGTLKGTYRRHKFNLRDLVAVRDIMLGNVEAQISHYEMKWREHDGMEQSEFDRSAIVDLVLRSALELVFKHRFESREAQDQVQNIIDRIVTPPCIDTDEMSSMTIDASVADVVRIGCVYMDRTEGLSSSGSLVHSERTVKQLSLLASACESQRTVLLEGGTCSKKTALVRELALLTGRPLLVLSLHRDCEVSNLIGQWLPLSPKTISEKLKQSIFFLRDEMLLHGMKMTESWNDEVLKREFFMSARWAYMPAASARNEDTLSDTVKRLNDLMVVLEKGESKRSTEFRRRFRLLEYECRSNVDSPEGLVFTFVEADLIKALESGHFVFFDDINAAPPDVIERVLSLFEETPSLNLYEHSDGKVLTRASGIHPETRIFAAADRKRINTYKMSNPLLNRMIKIWLPEIDSKQQGGLEFLSSLTLFIVGDVSEMKTNELKRHEIVDIVSEQLGSHAGGDVAALLSALFHAQVRNNVRTSKLMVLKDTSITFRTLKQAISVARTWLDRGEQLFTAVVWGLWRTYAAVVKETDDLQWLYEAMLQSCREARSLSLVNLSERRDKRIFTPFQRETRELRIVFASFIHVILEQLVTQFLKVQNRNEFREAMKSFLDTVFTKIYPEEKEACQELQNHLHDCHADMRKFRAHCGTHGCHQLRRITEQISETRKMTVNEYVNKNLQRLIAMYKEFMSNSTFSDWQQRRSFLEDTHEVLRSLIELADGNPHCQELEIPSMMKKAKSLLCIRHLTHYFRAFEKEYFTKSVNSLHELQNRCQNKALKFALQKELSKKVTDSGPRLRDSITALRDSSITKREENHLVLCFSLVVLDWKTSLRLHERLVLMHRAQFSAGEVLKLQILISRARLVTEMWKMRYKILCREEDEPFWSDAYGSGSKLHAHPISSAIPSSSHSSHQATSLDTGLRISAALERLDTIVRSPGSEATLCNDLDDAVKFHSQVLEDLLAERKKSKAPIQWNLNEVVSNQIGFRFDACSTSTRNSEFCLTWISLLCECERDSDVVPLKLLKCDEETAKHEHFSRDGGMQAAILIGDPSCCESLYGLVALVVFDNRECQQLCLYCCPRTDERVSQQEEWLLRWKGVHGDKLDSGDQLHLRKKELIVWSNVEGNMSSLGLVLMSCLRTLIEHRCQSADHRQVDKRTSILRTQMIESIDRL